MSDPRRFIGRKATACKKCSGVSFYVNRMGGVVCQECSPLREAADNCQALTIEGGVWIDPADRFEMVDVPAAMIGQLLDGIGLSSIAGESPHERSVTPATETPSNNESTSTISQITSQINPRQFHQQRSSRGPNGELSEVEYELFNSAAVWEERSEDQRNSHSKLDLITVYGGQVLWVSEMFAASDDADRQRANDVAPDDVKSKKERTAAPATSATASMFSV